MNMRAPRWSCKLLIILGLCSIQARAQLSTYVDNHGTLVFTNADLPAPPPAPAKAKTVKDAAPAEPQTAPVGKPVSAPTTVAEPKTIPAPSPAAASRITPAIAPAPVRVSPFASTHTAAPQELDKIVMDAAQKHHVDPELIRAVITTESSWNSAAVSSKGAEGLMQLVPGTAKQMGVGNVFDPAQNVDGGVRYLRMLLERYNGDLDKALAAYNAGPGAVDRFGGVPNFRETRDYVRKVTSTYYASGTDRQASVLEVSQPIYRTTDGNGRLIFTNE